MKIVCDAIKTMGDEDETLEAVQNIPTSELAVAYTDNHGLDGNFTSELTYSTEYNTAYYTSTDYNNNINNNNNNDYIINNAIDSLNNDNFITNANTTITNNDTELELERMLNEVHNGSSGGVVVTNEALEIVTTRPVTCVENVYDYDKLHAQTRNDLQQCFKLIDEQKKNIRQINEKVECKDKIIKRKNERETKWQLVLEKMQQQNDQLTAKLTHEQKSTCEQDVQTEIYTQKEHGVQTDRECVVDFRSVGQQTKILMTDRQVQTDFDDIEVDNNCRGKETDMLTVQQKYEELQEQFNKLKNKHDELVISESKNKLKRHAVEQTLTDGYKKFKNSVLETFDEMETRQKKMNDQKATIQKQEQMIAELQKQNTVLLDTYRQTKECVKTVNNKLIQSQNVVAFYKNECASIRQKYNNLLKK